MHTESFKSFFVFFLICFFVSVFSGNGYSSRFIGPTEQTYTVSGGNGNLIWDDGDGTLCFSPAPPHVSWSSLCFFPEPATGNCAPWITITSGTGDSYSGSINYSVAENLCSTPRSASFYVTCSEQFTLMQQGSSTPSETLVPSTFTFTAGGGAGAVAVTSLSGECSWVAQSNADWIAIGSGQSYTGNGTVSFTATPNTGPARTGTLTISGQTVTVTQAQATPPADECAILVDPQTYAFHIPFLKYERTLFTNDIIYVSLDMALVTIEGKAHFRVTNYRVLSNASALASCTPATMSPILNIHLPAVSLNNTIYWLNLKNVESNTGDLLFDMGDFGPE